MIGLVVVAAFAAAVATVVAARAIAGRAERKSVEGYERVLDTLGDVSRRSEHRAAIHVVTDDELAQPHVRAQSAAPDHPTGSDGRPPTPTIDAPKAPLPALPDRLVFVDHGVSAVSEAPTSGRSRRRLRRPPPRPVEDVPDASDVAIAMRFDDAADDVESVPTRRRGSRGISMPGGSVGRGRTGVAVLGAFGALAVVGIGGWRIAVAMNGTTHVGSPGTSSHPPHSLPPKTTTTTPAMYTATATSAREVDYAVPNGALHITFSSTGACWLGIFHGPGSNPSYAWMDTLAPNQSTSYDASGKTYVRIGNPPDLTVSVNGVPLSLPSGNSQPYNLVLVPPAT